MLDPQLIRKDFPILAREVYGKPLVYLDNAATSQKPCQVIRALTDYYEQSNSNVHRGVHALSMESTEQYEEARRKVAEFIHAPTPESIIFTRNTTEAINLVAHAWALENLRPGDEILVTEMEHHSNLVPWQMVAQQRNVTLRFIPTNKEGSLDLSSLDTLVNSKTRLVAAVHTSNFLGTVNPIDVICQRAREVNAFLLIDGAQSVPHMPTDVVEADYDFLAFSGHKMLAPTGIGVLYVKPSILQWMEPFLRGGEMVREVWFDHATWNDAPNRFEAGTPNIADTIGLGAAIDYLQALGMDNVRQHEKDITSYALKRLQEVEEVEIIGPPNSEQRGGLIAFALGSVHPHDIGTFLDREGIALRAGHHCAMPMHRKLGLSASARASFYVYNDNEDVDALIAGLKKTINYFGNGHRKRT
ncbi:MAG: cysteine desulfurase [SAR202 cluster bacterium Io17-Chloro-G3]|nr:MAG: cysteine desulfurase [SAR202 cluster bacterium Io17-Chloro-G3]